MPALTDEQLYDRLAAVTCPVLDQPELLEEWSRDWWPLTARVEVDEASLPAFAVMPETVEEVAAVLRIAAEAERPIVTRGGGTNMVGAISPVAGAIVLVTRSLNVIGAVDEIDCTVKVDSGVFGGELEARLNELGYTLGHCPRSLHLSTVGGWIATRAIGSFSTRYGGIEELLIGIEVVLPDGTIVRSRPTPRYGAGPRWCELFVGSEGVLGVIATATLRVRPMAEDRTFKAYTMPSFDDALEAIRSLLQRGVEPASIFLLDRPSSLPIAEQMEMRTADHALFVAFDGPAAVVDAQRSLTHDAVIAIGGRVCGEEIARTWIDLEFSFDWLIDGNEDEGAMADEIDVAAMWSHLPVVIAAGRQALEQYSPNVQIRVGHFNESGAMVGFRFFIQDENDRRAVERYGSAWNLLMKSVIDSGGSIVHHGGIGVARAAWLEQELKGGGMHMLHTLRQAIDPGSRMNPGNFLTESARAQ
jgi:alkyldihydroxyacetonephosphate synthase